MNLKTKDLAAAFSVVDNVGAISTVQASQTLRLKFRGSTLQLSLSGILVGNALIPTDTPWKKTFYINRRLFKEFLNAATGKIQLSVNGNEFTLRSGGSRLSLEAIVKVTGYSDWDTNKGHEIKLNSGVMELSKHLAKHISNTSNTPGSEHLQVVYFLKGYGVMTTSGYSLLAGLTKQIKETLALPPLLAPLLTSEIKLLSDDNGVGVVFGDGTTLYQTQSTSPNKYPVLKAKKLISSAMKSSSIFQTYAGPLRKICEYFNRFAFDVSTSPMLKFTADGKQMVVTMKIADGEVSQKLTSKHKSNFTSVLLPLNELQTFANSIEPTTEISYSRFEGCHSLTTSDKIKRVLVIADKSAKRD